MPIAKFEKNNQYILPPEGTHLARCCACIALGTQPSELFAPTERVLLMWELPDTKSPNGKPMTIHKEYRLSLHPKSLLRQHLEAWRGRAFTDAELQGFDVAKVVGAQCQLTIAHRNGKNGKWADVVAVTAVPKGVTVPELSSKPLVYEIDYGRDERFNSLPEWIQRRISQCLEWNQKEAPVAQSEPNDVPF